MPFDMQTLLKTLEEQGGALPSLEDGTGLAQAIVAAVAEQQVQAQALAQERDREFQRRQGLDSAVSKKDAELKALQAKLDSLPKPESMTPVSQNPELNELRGMVQQLVDGQRQQAEALAKSQAELARRDLFERLAKEYPVMNDPKFRRLAPETADETTLKAWAEGVSELGKAIEDSAHQRFRDGYVPATTPPRVIAGDEKSFQKELGRLEKLRDTRQITPAQFSAELTRLGEEFGRTQ